MSGFSIDIETATLENQNYRKILFTTKENQIVLMSILPQDNIPREVHPDISQFIRIEAGTGKAYVGDTVYELTDGVALDIPSGTYHEIVNTSTTDRLQLYTVYSPPEHPDGLVQRVKPVPKKINLKYLLLLL